MESLQELYEKSKTTLSAISKRTGFSISTIQRYVNGKVKFPTPEYENPIRDILEETVYKKENMDVKIEKDEHPCLNNDSNGKTENLNNNDDKDNNDIENDINVSELKEQMNRKSVTSSNYSSYQIPHVPKKGDILYIRNPYSSGNEMWGSRPAVCVGNSKLYEATGTVEVCYLTSKPKYDLPCRVNIKTDRSISILLCESVNTVSKDRITRYFGRVTSEELSQIENALLISFDIKHSYKEKIIEVPSSIQDPRVETLKIENQMLREFVEKLMQIAMK